MLHPSIGLMESTIHGTGLIATDIIRKGEIVWRLDTDAQRLTLDELKDCDIETFWEFQRYSFQIGEDEYVLDEGIGRYMNHSCNANTWWDDDNTLVAKREIHPGEEISYDYATTDIAWYFCMPCQCGEKNCRKTVTNLDYLDPRWQTMYGRNLPSFVLQAIERGTSGGKQYFTRFAPALMRKAYRLRNLVRSLK